MRGTILITLFSLMCQQGAFADTYSRCIAESVSKALNSSVTRFSLYSRSAIKFKKKSVAKYPVIKMNPKWIGEDQPGKNVNLRPFEQVHYIKNLAERERYRVVIDHGRLFYSSGVPLDSKGKEYIYVMDKFGNFYLSSDHLFGQFHHSSFFAGEPVAAAGEIYIKDGRILEINRRSGHYLPSNDAFKNALSELSRHGVDLRKVFIDARE